MGLVAGRNLKQQITYWAPGTRNSYNELSFLTPVLLLGRWVEKSDQVRSKSGDEVVTRALIHVNAEVAESGWLALGDHTGVPDPTASGIPIDKCAEIIVFQEYPDLRNLETSYAAYV